MKRLIALFLVCALLSACAQKSTTEPIVPTTDEVKSEESVLTPVTSSVQTMQFYGMDDPKFLTYLEDAVYADLVTDIGNGVFVVEEVNSVYISKEYLEESAYNEKDNIYFGYTLSELNESFDGKRYVFTLGDDGSTIVTEFVEYEESFSEALKTILVVGTGVIILCVTLKHVASGAIVKSLVNVCKSGNKIGMAISFAAPYLISASPNLAQGDIDGAANTVKDSVIRNITGKVIDSIPVGAKG